MARPRARRRAGGAVVVGYVRASTLEQQLGPVAQRAAIERWCQEHGTELVCVHEDLGVSGAAPLDARPGLLAALDAIREHGASALVVAKRDRLARSVYEAALAERLAEREGARVLSADGSGNADTAEGDLLRALLNAIGAYERACLRGRVRAALAVKRSRGEHTGGGVPFGYRLGADGELLLVDAEQETIARAVELRAFGHSLREVAARLAAEGRVSRGGRAFAPSQVARMLRGPAQCGEGEARRAA